MNGAGSRESGDRVAGATRGTSYVRIREYAALPDARGDGEWYARENAPGAVCVQCADAPFGAPGQELAQAQTRWTGALVHRWGAGRKGSLLYMLKYPVPCDFQEEFDAWFCHEHMPMLLEEPTWYGCAMYRAIGGSRYAFAALHDVEPQALTSDARNRSIVTPWWHRLARHAWFDKQFSRARLIALGR